eukprot:5697269-Prymnesium_polylepis.2
MSRARTMSTEAAALGALAPQGSPAHRGELHRRRGGKGRRADASLGADAPHVGRVGHRPPAGGRGAVPADELAAAARDRHAAAPPRCLSPEETAAVCVPARREQPPRSAAGRVRRGAGGGVRGMVRVPRRGVVLRAAAARAVRARLRPRRAPPRGMAPIGSG